MGTGARAEFARQQRRHGSPAGEPAPRSPAAATPSPAHIAVRALQHHAGDATPEGAVAGRSGGPTLQRVLAAGQLSSLKSSRSARQALKQAEGYLRSRGERVVEAAAPDALAQLAQQLTATISAVGALGDADLAQPERLKVLAALRQEAGVVAWLRAAPTEDPKRLARSLGMARVMMSGRHAGGLTYHALLASAERGYLARRRRLADQQRRWDAVHSASQQRGEDWTEAFGYRYHGNPMTTQQTPEAAKLKKLVTTGPPRLGGRVDPNAKTVEKQTHWEGWKVHVSADAFQAGELMEVLEPRLSGAAYKVAKSLQFYEAQTGTSRGKFLVVYPRTLGELLVLVATIQRGIDEVRQRHPDSHAPVVSGELALGHTGDVFTRYGFFAGEGEPPDRLLARGARAKAEAAAHKAHGHDWPEFVVFDPAIAKFVFDDRAKTDDARAQQLATDLDDALSLLVRESLRSGGDKARQGVMLDAADIVGGLQAAVAPKPRPMARASA